MSALPHASTLPFVLIDLKLSLVEIKIMRKTKDIHQSPNVHIAVQNFGPIENAEINLRPLTVFVGESNTGKTYLSAIIYALHQTFEGFSRSLTPQRQVALKNPQVFRDKLKRCFEVASVSELIRFIGGLGNEMQGSLKVDDAYQTAWAFDMRAPYADFAVNEGIEGRAQTE